MTKKSRMGLYLGVPLLAIAGFSALTARVETIEETRYEEITCKHVEQKSDELEVGASEIIQECKNGKRKIVEKVTYRNGEIDKRQTASTEVEEPAIDEIKLIGTKQPVVESQSIGSDSSSAAQSQPQTQTPAQSQSSASQNIDYSYENQHGYCKDGTEVYGNPHAAGRANVCYGHKGWVGN